MVSQQKQEYASIGQTQPVPNHIHDLVHELSDRIDAVWRYDQYIQNAEGMQDLRDCWQQIKQQDEQIVQKLKTLLAKHLQSEGGGAGQRQQQGGRMGQVMGQKTGAETGAGAQGGDRPI